MAIKISRFYKNRNHLYLERGTFGGLPKLGTHEGLEAAGPGSYDLAAGSYRIN